MYPNVFPTPGSIPIETFQWSEGPGTWDVLRLDKLHPVVSGNKPYKLQPFITRALSQGSQGVLTFGGPYSNHIHATAFLCSLIGLPCLGFIRGERPSILSPTLRDAESWGMSLQFVPRLQYRALCREHEGWMIENHPGWISIPEGGYAREGAEGAQEMLTGIPTHSYEYIVCASGTGTMAAGLRMAASPQTKIVAISVLKGHRALEADIVALIPEGKGKGPLEIIEGYHFGGYARCPKELSVFMERFKEASGIPTDHVYTGKLMFAVNDLFRRGVFRSQDRVLVIHSGGLQGNRSTEA